MATQTSRGRVRIEDGGKRVRILFGGEWIADTKRVKLVWERPYYPTYYLPAEDVRTDLLVATDETHHSASRGDAAVHTVEAGGREAQGAVSWYVVSEVEELTDHLRFEWDAMDAWFEEDEQVHVHPRDPYTRLDILQSSRHVRVELDGVTLADSQQPRLLFETGLPTRYYLPKTDVRMDLLRPSDTHTQCPYKGEASYYDLVLDGETYDDFVWWYPTPHLESIGIAGYVCFYNEKVDLYVDDELETRPRSPFS